jgi:hypothetical protein
MWPGARPSGTCRYLRTAASSAEDAKAAETEAAARPKKRRAALEAAEDAAGGAPATSNGGDADGAKSGAGGGASARKRVSIASKTTLDVSGVGSMVRLLQLGCLIRAHGLQALVCAAPAFSRPTRLAVTLNHASPPPLP